MSNAFYSRMAQTALRLIKDKGSKLNFYFEQKGEYDPIAGAYPPAARTDGFLNGVVLPASSGAKDNLFFGQTLRIEKQRYILLEALSSNYEPKLNHLIDIDGQTFKVMGVTGLKPAGITVIWKVGVTM